MIVDLSKIGMEKGVQYECIITTLNSENINHAAPIGILYSGNNTIICRIFKGSETLENITNRRKFIVNVTHNPELFLLSTLGNLPEDYFNEDNSIKNIDAYFKCEVEQLHEAKKQSDPVRTSYAAIVIKAKANELIINKPVKAFNRGFGYVIESLSNLSRKDIVDDDKKEEYLINFKEARRVVNKIGYKEDVIAMNMIKKEY